MNGKPQFLEKEKINNFNNIIEIIDTCGITPGTIAVEHIGVSFGESGSSPLLVVDEGF